MTENYVFVAYALKIRNYTFYFSEYLVEYLLSE